MKALLVTSASSETNMTQSSILYLASWLEKNKVEFEILDMSGTIDYFNPPDEFFSSWDSKNWLNPNIFHTDLSLDDHPEVDVVYYSSMFSTDILVHGRHAVKMKQLFPSCRTVLGGAAMRCLDSKQLSILSDIFDDVRLDFITGVELDYSLIPIKPFVTVYSGQGCLYGKCRFCSNSGLSNIKYYLREIDDVVADLGKLEKYDITDVMLSSDMFPRDYIVNLAEELIDRNINVPYNIMLRAEKWVDGKFSSLLKRSGCTDVFVGAEAFNNNILKVLNKGTNVDNNINTIESLYESDIKVEIGLILFIPKITKRQLDEQLEVIEKVLPYVNCVHLEILSITNRSEFSLFPERYGIELWPMSGKSIIPSWCYGFSPDIPWTFHDVNDIQLWINHYEDLKLLLADKLPSYYYESIDYLKGEFNI